MLGRMLASTGRLPTGAVVVEPKWDGVRSLVTVHQGAVSIRSRRGSDVTTAYPDIAADAPAGVSAVFDGEIVALDDRGLPSFQLLQRRMNLRRPTRQLIAGVPLAYVVFDVLWLDGTTMTELPLDERRRHLETVGMGGRWQLTSRFPGGVSDELIESLRTVGLEGVVVKRVDSPYRPGTRSPHWVKVKARQRALAVIGGVLVEGARSHAGSLAVGMYLDGYLHYVGQVGNGLAHRQADQLSRFLDTIGADRSPFVDLTTPKLRYVEPEVVVDIEYTETTAAGTFRQPVLRGVVVGAEPQTALATGHFADAITHRTRVDVGAGQRL